MLKTLFTRTRYIKIPHLCPADNKARSVLMHAKFREFTLDGSGVHTICCDGCKKVFQFMVIRQQPAPISPYGGNGDPIGLG